MELKNAWQGSTLAETLVTMLVAGIVLLTVMDGVSLFFSMQTRRSEALLENGRQTEGLFRLAALAAASDSIRPDAAGWIVYRRGGDTAVLSLTDSALIFCSGAFRDTLLTEVGTLCVVSHAATPDTLVIGFGSGLRLRFAAAMPVAEHYRDAVERMEEGYGYEE